MTGAGGAPVLWGGYRPGGRPSSAPRIRVPHLRAARCTCPTPLQEPGPRGGNQCTVKRVICISGDAASGKTTAARLLQQRLPGWQLASSGAVFREHCARLGLDPQQISHLGDDLHRAVDDAMRRRLEEEHNLIAEARLVGYLARDLADALRVFCSCPLPERARRFLQREPGLLYPEAVLRVAERDAADTAKLLRLYGVDYHDPTYYHLTVNTEELGPEEVAERILAAARA